MLTKFPYLLILRVPMIPDSVLLVEKLLFVGEWSEADFFVVGDFDKCFTLGQPDKLGLTGECLVNVAIEYGYFLY